MSPPWSGAEPQPSYSASRLCRVARAGIETSLMLPLTHRSDYLREVRVAGAASVIISRRGNASRR
jgi:hypothetical protein